jgi:integrase/recombinase XerC
MTKGPPLNHSTISTSLKVAAKRAGILIHVHPHGFRHTFAFELVMEGVPLLIIQVPLGHIWARATCVYIAHIAPADVIT